MGEEIAAMLAKEIDPRGVVINVKSNGSNHGFDIISISPNLDDPTLIRIIESKPMDAGNSFKLPETNNGPQMSRQWKRAKIDEMLRSSIDDVRIIGQVLDDNGHLIEGYVLSIDKELEQIVLMKLDNF